VLGAPVVVFPGSLALGMLAGAGLVTGRLLGLRAHDLVAASVPGVRGRLRAQSTAAASEVLAGGYTVASVAVVGAVAAPGVTASFSTGDRLFRGSLIPISALASALQPRVARETGEKFRQEARRALGRHAALALIGGGALAVLGGPTARLLFGDLGELPTGAWVAYGVAFAAISLNSSLARHVLVPLGRTRGVMLGSLAGSLVGVAGMVVGATSAGVAGAVWGLAAGELAVVLVLAVGALRAWRAPQERPASPATSGGPPA
jgi:PST family polysaccharide transporter